MGGITMEQKIIIPEGYELQKISDSEYKIVKKEAELPESWSEFCKMYPIKKEEEGYITNDSKFQLLTKFKERSEDCDKNLLPNKRYAEAILALCQLIQLRDCYRQGWKPNWNDDSNFKYCILFREGIIYKDCYRSYNRILSFQSEEIRDKFYKNFKDLIEKVKPLFM